MARSSLTWTLRVEELLTLSVNFEVPVWIRVKSKRFAKAVKRVSQTVIRRPASHRARSCDALERSHGAYWSLTQATGS